MCKAMVALGGIFQPSQGRIKISKLVDLDWGESNLPPPL